MIRDLCDFDTTQWMNWGVLGFGLMAFLLIAPLATQAQDVEQQVETNRQMIQSIFQEQQQEELEIYGYVSTDWVGGQETSSPYAVHSDKSHFESGRLAVFLDKQVSDKVRVSGELFFQNGAVSRDTGFVNPDYNTNGRIEASYYFAEYSDNSIGTFRAGKIWKPLGLQNEIGNNVPAIKTIQLPTVQYAEPGGQFGLYNSRLGAGVQYQAPSGWFSNPVATVNLKAQIDNGSEGDAPNNSQFQSVAHSKKTISGRAIFDIKKAGMMGLDGLKLAYSHDWDNTEVSKDNDLGGNNTRIVSLEANRGPVLFRSEFQNGSFAIQDFFGPAGVVNEEFETLYGTLFYDVFSNLTLYARYEEQEFGQVLGENVFTPGGMRIFESLDDERTTLGVNYGLSGMTLKGEWFDQEMQDFDADGHGQTLRAQAVVPF